MYTGEHLIALGYKPGKWFGKILKAANFHQLSESDFADFARLNAPQQVEPFETARPFFINFDITKASDLERENYEKVIDVMESIMKTPTVIEGALMPDACPTGDNQIPVGGVVAAHNAIHPGWHSADICCSVMITYFRPTTPEEKKEILDFAQSVTHFGPGGRDDNYTHVPQDVIIDLLNNEFLNSNKGKDASFKHLRTQGDGNHFLFLGESKLNGDTCLVTHHGSRGLGAELYRTGMKVAEQFRKQLSPETHHYNAWIPYDTAEGEKYWEALQTVRKWTRFNHLLIHHEITAQFCSKFNFRFWNEHNFVFKEGETFYHAKGATPLKGDFVPDNPYDLRIVPLNMGQPILIVKGEKTNSNLGFAPHGAGRNMSRGQHKRSLAGKTQEEIFAEETAGLDVRFFSGNIDISELPSAYKSADTVRREMEAFQLGTVVDEIVPYGCIMAGDWEKDSAWRKRRDAKETLKAAVEGGKLGGTLPKNQQ